MDVENPTLEELNAQSGERRLIVVLSLLTLAVCLPGAVTLALTLPKPAHVLLAAPAPPTVAPPISMLKPAPIAPPRVSLADMATPTPAVPTPAAPAVSRPPTAPPRSVEASVVRAAPARGNRLKRDKPRKALEEIWPPVAAPPRDVRLAAPADDDGPGADELKRPTF